MEELARALGAELRVVREEPADASTGRATGAVSVVRFATARDVQFTAVRKVLVRGEDVPPWHWTYWRRELLAYEAGFFRAGQELSACRLIASHECPDEITLWLSEAPVEASPAWSLTTFATAARHLGLWHRKHVGRRRPEEWLVADQLSQRIDRTDAAGGLELPISQLGEDAAALWDFRHTAVDRRRRLPQTLSHGDFSRGNLFAVSPSSTVVIDLATLGIAPVGADLATLVINAFELLGPREWHAIVPVVFDEYAAALGDSVLKEDPWQGFVLTFAPTAASRLCWTLQRDGSLATVATWTAIAAAARAALSTLNSKPGAAH